MVTGVQTCALPIYKNAMNPIRPNIPHAMVMAINITFNTFINKEDFPFTRHSTYVSLIYPTYPLLNIYKTMIYQMVETFKQKHKFFIHLIVF